MWFITDLTNFRIFIPIKIVNKFQKFFLISGFLYPFLNSPFSRRFRKHFGNPGYDKILKNLVDVERD